MSQSLSVPVGPISLGITAEDAAADLDRIQLVTHALAALDELHVPPDSEHPRHQRGPAELAAMPAPD